MKSFAMTIASLLLMASSSVQAQQPNMEGRRLSPEDVRRVAPALEKYTQQRLYGEVWKRPGLSPRDRSIVTIAALIARDLAPMPYYFSRALDNGVKPSEISEIITHLLASVAPSFGLRSVHLSKEEWRAVHQ
jgi:4-carboxymuconolactone decarboxylase